MFKRTKLSSLIAGTSLLLCLGAAPAHAGYLSNNLTSGVDNVLEDQSREAFFDNGDGVFGVGDILTGFVRIDDITAPGAVDVDNRMYAIFSQEVTSVVGTTIEFGAVTSDAGLTLAGLGVVGAGATDMVAVYTDAGQFSVDLILASPGEQTGGGGVTMADYLALILAEGELEMLAGIVDLPTCTGGTADCFQASSGLAGATTDTFIGLDASVTVGNFVGAMESSLDPQGFVLADVVSAGIFSPPAAPLTLAELAIKNGAISGSGGLVNESEWIDGSELSARDQCIDDTGANVICGFADDADFVLHPEGVPEPTTLALLGISLLGFGASRRQRKS